MSMGLWFLVVIGVIIGWYVWVMLLYPGHKRSGMKREKMRR